MAPPDDDVEQSLLRLKILNFTVQTLIRSYEDTASDYKSAALRSMLDMVHFLFVESQKRLELLERQLALSPTPAETGRPMKVPEVAELLRIFRQLDDDERAAVISKARELEAKTNQREDAGSGR